MRSHTVLLVAAMCVAPIHVEAQIKTQAVASGLSQPVAFVEDPAIANVFYIVEQGGLVKVLGNGQVQSQPFVDLRGEIASGGERGLLGIAFSPNVGSGRVYFNYTNASGHTVVSRFRRSAAEPFRVDLASRLDLQWPSGERFIRQPFANHNGGHLAFGPDGYLYVGLGDGGSGNDPQNHAQNSSSLLGKMLRVDVNVDESDPVGYRIPEDNPFLDGQPVAALSEIWAFGLRNPWRYSFDDLGSGASGGLLIADVGQGAREEINFEPAGAGGRNYGWRMREGRIATPNIPPTSPAFGPLIEPIYDYGRDLGQAVTGGFVYRGSGLSSAYRGRYFFADSSSGRVFSLGLGVDGSGQLVVLDQVNHTGELGGTGALGPITSFGRDRQGELYLVSFSGRVLKIVADTGASPTAPVNVTAAVAGTAVTITWMPASSGPMPSGFQLEAGSLPGASNVGVVAAGRSETLLSFTNISPGTYYVRVRAVNAAGTSSPSNEAAVTVRGDGCTQPPTAPSAFAAAVNGNVVSLTWDMPATENPAAQWRVEAGTVTGAANLAVIVVDGSLRVFSAQAPPGRYYVRIRGANACGTGAASTDIIADVF